MKESVGSRGTGTFIQIVIDIYRCGHRLSARREFSRAGGKYGIAGWMLDFFSADDYDILVNLLIMFELKYSRGMYTNGTIMSYART
ncbi:hypothetical protein KC19_7G121300 [Ceratodon purpureus]|uniref:Uncharacterized protein n=1 Tax=Ceratodon purpureus TaxID=3225 RepID=A0A8T0H5M2_CERPU|nr:hypothetical protein KC19_7G121300 [Ceratodon purpureus]